MSGNVSSLWREAWATSKKNYAKTLPNISIFVLATIAIGAITMALYYVSGFVALLAIPFLLVPFVFALQTSYGVRESTTLGGVPTILTRFGSYFSSFNFGSYRLIRNFLWSYVISQFLSLVIIFVMVSALSGNPAYADSLQAFYEYVMGGQIDEASALIGQEPFKTLILTYSIFSMASYLAANLYFFFRALPIPYIEGNIRQSPARLKVTIFAGGNRMQGSRFESKYWGLLWPLFLLSGVSFGLGSYGGYFLVSSLLAQQPTYDPMAVGSLAVLFGFFLMCIALAFFSPYFFECLLLIARDNGKYYNQYGYLLMKQNLEYLRATERMRQEQASNLEETLRNMEKGEDVIDAEATEKDPAPKDEASSGSGASPDDYGRSDSHRE